jgi:hypothetical protein
MLGREEILRSLSAAWRLFLNQPAAMRDFDVSVDGFWRSFAAIGLIVPVYALTAIAEYQVMMSDAVADQNSSGAAFAFDKMLTLGVDWIALPILLAALARPLGITRNYPAFVVARNWASVLAILPFGAIALLYGLGAFGTDASNFLSLAFLIVILRYNFVIARRALEASIGLAIGLVALDFVVSLAIADGMDALFGF